VPALLLPPFQRLVLQRLTYAVPVIPSLVSCSCILPALVRDPLAGNPLGTQATDPLRAHVGWR